MKLRDVQKLLEAKVITGEDKLDNEARYVFGCDLMSDVLAFVKGETILLTGLTNIQTIRTAEMTDIKCIIFVRGKQPDANTIKMADELGICLMYTKHIMYTSCGILYENGLRGADVYI